MQGKKHYQEMLFSGFQLSSRVTQNNFYRRLRAVLDLSILYKLTEPYYGSCGQKSIDPVVFFKLCLVGYLENIISDRQLIEHCSMRLDILLFLGYDIDEELPWHSTLSRTRQLLPDTIFEQVFTQVVSMCVEKGMVSGHMQCIDSAPVKANASMDSLELKVPADELDEHLRKLRYMSTPDRKAKQNKAPQEQRNITATERELKSLKSRNKKWKQDQDERPGAKRPDAKYTSNKTHYNPMDPDARISVKPGKAPEKRITITIYNAEYERAIARVRSKKGRYMKSKRQNTIEPVFGTLTQFTGMRKINTLGISQANKVMMMAAMAYNLKKYLKFTRNKVVSLAKTAEMSRSFIIDQLRLILLHLKQSKTYQLQT